MKGKATPGPWSVLHGPLPYQWQVTAPEVAVADVYADARWVEANAHLISAAPEMLAALEETIAAFADLGIDATLPVLHARAAIAKAKGKKL